MTIREIWKGTFKIATAADFREYASADLDEVNAYEEGAGPGPGSNLVLDLAQGQKNSRWNQAIITLLYSSIVQARSQDPAKWNLPDVTEIYILALLDNQLKEAKTAWSMKQLQLLDLPDGSRRYETDEEVKDRVEQYLLGRWGRVSCRALRREVSLFH